MEICIVCHKPIEGRDYSDGNFIRDHHYVWHFECDEPTHTPDAKRTKAV